MATLVNQKLVASCGQLVLGLPFIEKHFFVTVILRKPEQGILAKDLAQNAILVINRLKIFVARPTIKINMVHKSELSAPGTKIATSKTNSRRKKTLR